MEGGARRQNTRRTVRDPKALASSSRAKIEDFSDSRPTAVAAAEQGVKVKDAQSQAGDLQVPVPLYHLDLNLSGDCFKAESFNHLRDVFQEWFPDAQPSMPDLSREEIPRKVSDLEALEMLKRAELRHPELKYLAAGGAEYVDLVSEDEEEREALLERENGAQILKDRAKRRQEQRGRAVKAAHARERALYNQDVKDLSSSAAGKGSARASANLSTPSAKVVSSSSSSSSSPLKRKPEANSPQASTYMLDCELVQDSREGTLSVVAFPPFATAKRLHERFPRAGSLAYAAQQQRLERLKEARFESAAPQEVHRYKHISRYGTVLGKINLSQIDDLDISREAHSKDLFAFQGVTLELRAPFMPHDNIIGLKSQTPEGRAVPRRVEQDWSNRPEVQWRDPITFQEWDDCPLPFTPPPEIFGRLEVDLCLAGKAFQYGLEEEDDGFVDEVYGRSGRGKKLVTTAKAMSQMIGDAVTHPRGLVEINPDDPTYFSRFPATFHPMDNVTLGVHSLFKGKARQQGNGAFLGESSQSQPTDNSLQGALEACRPPSDHSMKEPNEAIITPLMPFQKQTLAWMLHKETCVDEDRGLVLPQWIPFRLRKGAANAATNAETRNKRAKVSNSDETSDSNRTEVDGLDQSSCFYFDMTTGMTTKKRFECRNSEAGGCLCSDMGLGKSIVVLATIATNPWTSERLDHSRSAEIIAKIAKTDEKPLSTPATLIIVPATLVEQWLDETRKHWRSLKSNGVVRWRRGHTINWTAKDDRARIRERVREILCSGAEIVFATYEDLRWELSESKKSSKRGERAAISPLLEVKWHRIVLDEAQMVSTSNGHAAEMVNSLWRSIGWIVTSTLFSRSLEDLLGLYTFLDSDLAAKKVFHGVLAEPFRQGDTEAILRVHRALPKIMWRHDRRHVEDQLKLPPNATIDLELEMTGLERAIYEREYRHIQSRYTNHLCRGRSNIDQAEFSSLRQLISHPQLAMSLGYGAGSKRATFEQLFTRLLTKSNSELHSRRMEVVTLILTLAYGHQARHEEKNKRMWKGGGKVWSSEDINEHLREARDICLEMMESQQAHGKARNASELGKKGADDDEDEYEVGNLSSILRPREARYWCSILLGEEPQRTPRIDPERMTKLFFDKAVVDGDKIDKDDPRYHPMTREDVGEDEETDIEAEANVATTTRRGSNHDSKAHTSAPLPSSSVAKDTEFIPIVIKQRLRGGKIRKNLEQQYWHLVPKTRLATSLSHLVAVKELLLKGEREHLYLKNRMQEEMGHHHHLRRDAEGEGKDITEEDAKREGEQADRSCVVCMDAILVAGMLPCLHSACFECLVQCWKTATRGEAMYNDALENDEEADKAKKARCPVCRAPFSRRDITEVLSVSSPSSDSEGSHGVDDDAAAFGAKICGLVRDIRKRRAQDPTVKIVVFSMFKKYLSFVAEALLGLSQPIISVAFNGLPELQSNALAQFRDDKDIVVMLVPMRQSEGAAGLTLTMASVAYFLEPSLDPALEQQASGRLNRIGQQGAKTTNIRLIVKNTIEPRIVEIAARRQRNKAQSAEGEGMTREDGGSSRHSSRKTKAGGSNKVTMLDQTADGGVGNHLSDEELAFVFEIDVPAARQKRREEREAAREANATGGRTQESSSDADFVMMEGTFLRG